MTKTILDKIKNVLLLNVDIASTGYRRRKHIIVNTSFIVIAVVFLIFLLLHTIQESFLMLYSDLFFILASVLGLYLLRKDYDIDRLATLSTMLLFMIPLIVLVARSGIEYTPIWSLIFAFAVMMLKGAKKGLYYSIVFYSITFTIVYNFIDDAITIAGYIRLIAVSIIMTIMAYVYEKTTENMFDMLKHSIKEVEDLNENLELKIREQTKEQSLLLSLFDKGNTVLFKWNCDDNWSIDTVSLSVETLTGYSKNYITSNKIDYASLIHQDDIQRVRNEVSQAEKSNIEFFNHKPYRITSKDGTTKTVLDYTIIVRDENDNITHYIGAISDITELKQQEELIQKQSRLAKMGEMISMIAHQWRQPLSAVSSSAIDLQMKIELKSFDLDTKEGQVEQNLSITIDDFRNFYKANKKSVTIKLEDLISKSLNIIKASLINDKIELIQEYNSNQEIELYDSELMQVILNILKNAQDNFQEREIKNPKIIIKTKNRTISICDNGKGIPEYAIKKIFDPYFSTKDEKNGTGLGLYMSKTIIEEHHNGKLSAKNTNDGVCFTIELGDILQK